MVISKPSRIVGFILVLLALVLSLVSDPFQGLKQPGKDVSRFWYDAQSLPAEIKEWKGQSFEFPGWVYSYIPKAYLLGFRYQDPGYPTRYIEINVVHSRIKEYLHDPSFCSYGQGVEQRLVKTVKIPHTSLKAALSQLKVMQTGEIFYQLSWYQWGNTQGSSEFTQWLPQALVWTMFHTESPQWHYFNLIYVDTTQSLGQEQAEQRLTAFAALLESALRTQALRKDAEGE